MNAQTKPACQEQVPQYPGSYLYRDCGITASTCHKFHEAALDQEGGKLKWYCRRHAPSIIAANNAAWDAKWAAERAEVEAKQRQQTEDARNLAAFDELLAAAEEMRDWAMVITLGESPGHPLLKLRVAIKRARSA